MAPDLAISALARLKPGSTILDPMAGSGTVLRHASELGFKSFGFDMDPLAVLMARVWTQPVDHEVCEKYARSVLREIARLDFRDVELPWIDNDERTTEFIAYWFGVKQRHVLRRIASVLWKRSNRKQNAKQKASLDLLKVALSRIVITKEQGASLARDVSHSRPHKVRDISDFEVLPAFERSIQHVMRLLEAMPPKGMASVQLGDARCLDTLLRGKVDAVITSPPYLNAIDYMRGHRLSLVWLGYTLGTLSKVRSDSIGAERGPDDKVRAAALKSIQFAMTKSRSLPSRHRAMIARYSDDVFHLMSAIERVLRPKGTAILVVGNSCLKGQFIRNSDGVLAAAKMAGLKKVSVLERDLPERSRYLPLSAGTLAKRMRTETVLTLRKQ